MRKEQKIQEAYGSNWELIKPYVNEDGWFIWTEECPVNLVITGFEYNKNLDSYRPMILKGIESNNGWISIESEKDFPTEDNSSYWIIKNGEIKMFHWEKGETLNVAAWLYTITHYQVIEKPKPPIY